MTVGVFDLEAVASLDEALVIVHEYLWLWDNPPLDPEKKF